ncbi:MAG TPA: hypothetical protein VMJ10_13290 [Kofleriaceae bacterium]|nr:hypothetical protein [Kofleriaceae bacterium]
MIVRRAGSLALLAAVAMSPWLLVAADVGAASDLAHARAQLVAAWIVAGTAWVGQLWLVAGVVALRRGEPLANCARALASSLVPWLVAVLAIALGFAALVVPGFVLLVLLAPTGASTRIGDPLPAPLVDAAALARRDLRRVALLVAGTIVVDLALAGAATLLLAPALPKTAPVAALHATRLVVVAVALAVSALAPLPAWLLARAVRP